MTVVVEFSPEEDSEVSHAEPDFFFCFVLRFYLRLFHAYGHFLESTSVYRMHAGQKVLDVLGLMLQTIVSYYYVGAGN